MSSLVTHNYSKAIVELAVEKGILDQVQTAASELGEALKLTEVTRFLTYPKIPAAGKKDLVDKLLPENCPQEFRNLIYLLIDRSREVLLPSIIEQIMDMAIQAQGYEIVELISAKPLSDTKQAAICTNLEATWKTRLFMKYRQNAGLIGGIIIKRGDELIDGSLTGQLRQLKQVLMEEIKLSM